MTAAHCIHNKGQPKKKRTQDIKIRLGAHNLHDNFENGIISLSPSNIIVHEDWNPQIENVNADIAMIFVEDPITFSRNIKPICILDPSINFDLLSEGWAVGWGQSEDKTKKYEAFPRKLKVHILSNEDCFLKDPRQAKISSKQTFCAGTEIGAGVCKGDSGSGLFVSIQNKMYLAGIVSASLAGNNHCDLSEYAIFTNIIKMFEWIERTGNLNTIPLDGTTGFTSSNQPVPQKEINTNFECGMPDNKATGLIVDGSFVVRGDFPW